MMRYFKKINDIQKMIRSFGKIDGSNYEKIWKNTTEILGDDGDSFEPAHDYITIVIGNDESRWFVDIYPDKIELDEME